MTPQPSTVGGGLGHLPGATGEGYTTPKVGTGAKQHAGAHLGWGYVGRTVELPMGGYVMQAPMRLGHGCPQATCAPPKYTPPSYGPKAQFATIGTTPPLGETKVNSTQRAIGDYCTMHGPLTLPCSMLPMVSPGVCTKRYRSNTCSHSAPAQLRTHSPWCCYHA